VYIKYRLTSHGLPLRMARSGDRCRECIEPRGGGGRLRSSISSSRLGSGVAPIKVVPLLVMSQHTARSGARCHGQAATLMAGASRRGAEEDGRRRRKLDQLRSEQEEVGNRYRGRFGFARVHFCIDGFGRLGLDSMGGALLRSDSQARRQLDDEYLLYQGRSY
jgi:hypothetical protein